LTELQTVRFFFWENKLRMFVNVIDICAQNLSPSSGMTICQPVSVDVISSEKGKQKREKFIN